jgi:hypothetical protein
MERHRISHFLFVYFVAKAKGGYVAGQTINMQPAVLNLELYSGDGFSFRMICKNAAGEPIDMGGTVKAQIRKDRTTPEDPPIQEFTVGMTDAFQGIIVLSVTGEQTQSLTDDAGDGQKFSGVWDVEWEPSESEPRTICQGTVECVADVTR